MFGYREYLGLFASQSRVVWDAGQWKRLLRHRMLCLLAMAQLHLDCNRKIQEININCAIVIKEVVWWSIGTCYKLFHWVMLWVAGPMVQWSPMVTLIQMTKLVTSLSTIWIDHYESWGSLGHEILIFAYSIFSPQRWCAIFSILSASIFYSVSQDYLFIMSYQGVGEPPPKLPEINSNPPPKKKEKKTWKISYLSLTLASKKWST